MPNPEQVRSDVSIRLPARLDNLPDLIGPVLAAARLHGLGEERLNDLELALEEALVNIIGHAYPEGEGVVGLGWHVAEGRFSVIIEDEGIPFSVAAADSPDLSGDIMERRIGGLGVHLIRNLTDEVRCRREGTRNLLELDILLQSREAGQ